MVDVHKVLDIGRTIGITVGTTVALYATYNLFIEKLYERENLEQRYEETFGFPPYDLSPEKIKDSLKSYKKISKIQTHM